MAGRMMDGKNEDFIYDNSDRKEKRVDIYCSADEVKETKLHKDFEIERTTFPQPTTGSVYTVSIFKAVTVCLGLVCFLLLISVILMSVNNKCSDDESSQLLTNISNLLNQRNQLLISPDQLLAEKAQLFTNMTIFLAEENQLLNAIKNASLEEMENLQAINTNLTKERTDLLTKLAAGWIYHNYSLYYFSQNKLNWNTSRQNCTGSGADLVIINSIEEENFTYSNSQKAWVGLHFHGNWTWVDGSQINFTYWKNGNPNNQTLNQCGLIDSQGIINNLCNQTNRWVCEKTIIN